MSGYQDQEEQQNGLRRRGKNNGNRKSTNMNKDEKSRPTSVLLGRNSTIIEANPRDDEGESDLDAPLIGGGDDANENVRILNDSQSGASSPSAGDRRSIGGIGCNSANNDGSGSGANLRGTLTTTNNGAWNRLSCVSTMLATCLGTAASSTSPPGSPAGCTSASASSFDGNNNSNGNSGNNNNNKSGVLTTAVDVACAIVDKLPKFMANKLGPNSRKLEPKQQNFVDGLRAAFAVPYNRSDAAHVAIVKDLYRHYYALCCRDADPLIDTAAYIDHFSPSCGSHFGADARIGGSAAADGGGEERRWGGPSPSGVNEEGKEEAEEDPISSEFWKLIGFQGTNPGTDFRGGGVLSLLLLLHLFRSRPDLVRSIFTAREAAPNTPPPPKAQSTASTTSSADPDFHFAPPFFVAEMTEHITAATASSSSASAITDVEAAARGGEQFLTCDYPFAIAAINVAMHQMLLLGVETKTTCMATTDNIGSFSARLASSKLLKIAMDDNGNCASHAEHPSSCRPHLRHLVATYRGGKSAISTSFSTQPSPASPTRDPHQHLYDGFDHLAAVFETAIAVMHNEWDILPPPEKNILFFNQVLQRAREKTEVMLRRCDNILALGRSVEGYSWVTY